MLGLALPGPGVGLLEDGVGWLSCVSRWQEHCCRPQPLTALLPPQDDPAGEAGLPLALSPQPSAFRPLLAIDFPVYVLQVSAPGSLGLFRLMKLLVSRLVSEMASWQTHWVGCQSVYPLSRKGGK